jgi:hypothetical protein
MCAALATQSHLSDVMQWKPDRLHLIVDVMARPEVSIKFFTNIHLDFVSFKNLESFRTFIWKSQYEHEMSERLLGAHVRYIY